MMRLLFGPDDWLGRQPNVCLLLPAVVIFAGDSL